MEKDTSEKHEYYKGGIFAMAGVSNVHNIIFKNTFGNLFIVLKGKNCQPLEVILEYIFPKILYLLILIFRSFAEI